MNKFSNRKIYEKLPSRQGVYLFKDSNGRVLYIGKALNLKNRVKNYYKQKLLNSRTSNLLKKTQKVDFIIANTEIESLLLEARLIKEYQPKYNIRLKDDKRFLYVGITNEEYPAVRLLRQPEKEVGFLDWFGPFPSAQSIRGILRAVRRIFPFRSCKKLPKSPCLYYHLRLCPGMCLHPVKNYNITIRAIKAFLGGEISLLVEDLERKMKKAASELGFEKAASYKKQIQMIESLLLKFKKHPEEGKLRKQLEYLRRLLVRWQGVDPMVIHRLEAFDVANLGRKIIVGAMAVFVEGEPDNSFYRRFKIRKKVGGDPGAIKEILLRRFNHPEWIYPQLVLIDGGKAQVGAAFEVLRQKDLTGQVALLGLVKKEEIIVVPQIRKGVISGWKFVLPSSRVKALPLLQYARDEAHRFAQKYYHKLYKKITFESFGPKQKLRDQKRREDEKQEKKDRLQKTKGLEEERVS